MTIRTMSEVMERLAAYERMPSDVAYTLDRIRDLMKILGNPQEKLRVIHVAGTSGKTSTSYYIAGLLYAAGKQVGLSVSPHIDTVQERTQINMRLINEVEYCQLFDEFIGLVEQSGSRPSYFELMVAFSYWAFAKRELEFAVMEVGLGGLLDGTNVVTRTDKVCVITDIGYDHMDVLGNTLPEIAAQKAGIIHPGNSVFMHHQDDEIEKVVQQIAEDEGASVQFVDVNTTFIDNLPLFQQRNFALALSAVKSVIDVSESEIRNAQKTYIPGRMEIVNVNDGVVILDGAHNGQKIQTLTASLKKRYPDTRMTIVAAFNGNRYESMQEGLAILKDIADRVIATGFESHQDAMHQSLDPEDVASEARRIGILNVDVVSRPSDAMAKALQESSEYILVVGSFYLLQYVRQVLGSIEN